MNEACNKLVFAITNLYNMNEGHMSTLLEDSTYAGVLYRYV